MAALSTIKRLPPKIKAEVDGLMAGGHFTIDQIVDHLRGLNAKVSRSAVGRYKQNFDKVAIKIRQSNEMAAALVKEIGPAAIEGKTGRLLVQILQTLIFDHLMARMDDDEGSEDLSTMDIMLLAKSIKEMAQATKLDADRELKIREAATKEATEKAAEIVDGLAKDKGLPPEVPRNLALADIGHRSECRSLTITPKHLPSYCHINKWRWHRKRPCGCGRSPDASVPVGGCRRGDRNGNGNP